MRRRVLVVSATLVLGVLASACASGTSSPRAEPAATSARPAATPSSAPTTVPTASATTASAATATTTTTTPCSGSHAAKRVIVRLRAQHLWFCQRGAAVRDSPVTSGMLGQYTETPTGTYRIQERERDTTLTLLGGATYEVKYWIPFDGPLFGFHDSSWQDFPYGSAKYKRHGSHGCVHLPLSTIRFLYRWAPVGTSVQIAD